MSELLDFHRRTMAYAVSIVNTVEPEQLSLPTPCAEWDLGQLLAHMTAQDRGFAAAARGEEFDPAAWAEGPLSERFAETFAASAEEVVAAFNEPDAAQREWLVLVGSDTPLPVPGERAVGFHLIDYVVHAWDVAVSIGREPEFDPLVLSAVLTLAEEVPLDGSTRIGPHAPFAPALELEGGDGLLEQILALLGRDPEWSAEQS
ncbi:TIGR03086 family metal-binding protein [Glycomyces harbinensis]|uniref:TIGR03086 family protein n=1 Tax=Glycomyces harbinensis TaxID=58114 RepID=A0A1G7B3E7_9ACTN|nr:TIGR03086 family metal-binding protein [Glycomyces harbinensis]SDE21551.1 TIGR03086 family protein [Glycomyces harbinensis]